MLMLWPQVTTGKNPELIKRLSKELDAMGVPVWLRRACLIWDEINLVGQVSASLFPLPSRLPSPRPSFPPLSAFLPWTVP